MYLVDLKALKKCSKTVSMTPFGKVHSHGSNVFTDWLVSRINQAALVPNNQRATSISTLIQQNNNWENTLRQALGDVWRTDTLMDQGHDVFAQQVAEAISKKLEDETPIYPIFNSEWKSDAWLGGLALSKDQLYKRMNPSGHGFGLSAKPLPEKACKIPLKANTYDVLYVDDASYSGTQIFNLLNSVWSSGLRPNKVHLMLAGISQTALQKIVSSMLLRERKCTPVFDQQITAQMRMWGAQNSTLNLLRHFYGAMTHIEADPNTLKPKPTQGEFPIFTGNCLAVLPYKIPDSLSVPTHLYLGYNPDHKSSIFENEGGHVFTTNGGVNYRTVMPSGAEHYAKLAQ
ncbi:hypothetical protein [Andreprevotia chitinilytica]|uniref:hypothetical protein n=1 Tax=Andreprevotia chitinilytica TaxID=396808 RepID=UPI00054FD84E|nr:hypothetical protein [Andreprevotia chitinilytica]